MVTCSCSPDAVVSPDTPNVLKAMMKLEQSKTRAKTGNKLPLVAEKGKDDDEQVVKLLQQLLQTKRARTHTTTDNAHEECDN